MPWLTQLATVARRTGYPVTEMSGWKGRGHGPQPEVQGVVCHHTAGPAGGGDYPSLVVVRDGRPDLDGPLSHFGLGRSGRIYVIAAGRCWHNAPSTSPMHDNSSSLGIEAENNGTQPWPDEQLDAYHKLCAELCQEFRLGASRVVGHKEVNRQKPDPHGVDMDDFRADVARLIKAGNGDGWPGRLLRYPPVTRGADVSDWQQAAVRLGYKLDVDGAYGADSREVCRKIQRGAGLDDDGVVGRLTWAATFHAR